MPSECIFCKIVSKQIPGYTVYEDDKFLSFLDIHPLTKGNCLVIPKKHYQWTYDVPEFGDYFEIAKKVGLAAQKAFSAEWICFLTLGLEVPHAHIRVIPRYPGDKHGEVVNLSLTENYSTKQMAAIATKITANL